MIIYTDTIKNFSRDVFAGVIADKLEELFIKFNIGRESQNEYRSWMNSLRVMSDILNNSDIDRDVQVAIEYQIPLTSKRVDFLVSGLDENGKENIVAIELKQWQKAEKTGLENVVKTYVSESVRPVAHPSQQILSYCQLITNFNLSVREDEITLTPCALLHNFDPKYKDELEDERYSYIVSKAPLFYKTDALKMCEFITRFVKKPANRDLFEVIDNGKLKPSKALQDAIVGLVEGNEEFTMVDEQQVAYSTVMDILRRDLASDRKYTVIVEGGPGTGKSVIAIQLLAHITKEGYTATYITKNSAPRNVFAENLVRGHKTKKYIKGLFKSPISFEHSNSSDLFDCMLIDEAHRLTTRYGNNQIDDLIKCSRVNVFFIDEDQRVTTKDIGTKQAIIDIANKYGSRVVTGDALKLTSQFRCNGSDGYMAFLDNALGIKDTANTSIDGIDYDFRVFDNPVEMREELRKINMKNNKARMLAGYCYEWVSKGATKDEPIYDIKLQNGFRAKWNFADTGTWAIDEESFDQVGCIHTSQGLEFDYCGVIIGFDMRYENGKVITDQTAIAESDKSSGIKKCKNHAIADHLIRNTYKTLMSRGQKGCFVYCQDKELAEYLRKLSKQ